MRGYRSKGRNAFTLIECLVVMAILMVLSGIVYAGMAPVREKARETHCANNLRQIARAIQMYQQDYGGREVSGPQTYSQLGLPPRYTALQPYLKDQQVWQCPSEYLGPDAPKLTISYFWQIEPDEKARPPVPPFSQTVGKRGDETVLLADPFHGTRYRSRSRQPFKVLVLRLNGQIQSRTVPWEVPSWEW